MVSVGNSSETQREILQTIRDGTVHSQVLIDAQSYTSSNHHPNVDDSVEVLDVATSRDLRRIGILTTKVLSRWTDPEASSTVCLHTLSALLTAVDDDERVFRFVHLLQERVRSTGARAYFYLDPARHDQQTIRTFFSLFDTILEFDVDGSLRLL